MIDQLSFQFSARTSNQRWRDRTPSFRSTGELITTSEYEVVLSSSDKVAKAFVEQHHYSGTYPAARERGLLYRAGELVGVAVFSQPASEAVLEILPCDRAVAVELGRFILLDNVPGNGESWFLARCFELLRAEGYEGLLSHSDPVARRSVAGDVVLPGHVGLIYQATNAIYTGRSNPTLHVLKPNGTIFSPRSMTKIRRWERGARKCVDELVSIGAEAPTANELADRDGRRAWMWRAIGRTCRRLAHGGNHRYVWALDRRIRKAVAALRVDAPYPKQLDVEAA